LASLRFLQSITILPMSRDFGWSEGQQGLIQAAFFVGYAFPQLPGGVLADRFGGKQVLGSGVLFWSLSTVFTPLSARHTLNSLLLCRALMGVGEGVAMPAMNSLIARHVPPSERSRALSTVYSGFFLGSAAGLGVSPFLVSLAGWPSVFYIFGASGIVWWFFWATQATNGPEEDSKITEAERARISLEQTGAPVHEGDSSRAQQKTQIPWKSFLRSQAVWSIIISHFSNSWGSFIILTWLPTYLKSFNLSLEDTGALALLPWVRYAFICLLFALLFRFVAHAKCS
jgi:ACS family sodium-dependent inorganic phosphate cotransporter